VNIWLDAFMLSWVPQIWK